MDCGMKMSPAQVVKLALTTLIQTVRRKHIHAQKRAPFPMMHHPCPHVRACPENTTSRSPSSVVTAPVQNRTSRSAPLSPKQVQIGQHWVWGEHLVFLCHWVCASAGSTGSRASVPRGGSALSAQQKSRKELLLEKLREQLIKAKRFAVKMYNSH